MPIDREVGDLGSAADGADEPDVCGGLPCGVAAARLANLKKLHSSLVSYLETQLKAAPPTYQ